MNRSLVILAILGVLSSLVNGAQKVRGVAPERASLYDESKQFSCLDGSGVIPFSQVNDDYCDCRDGSDEPGTAACLNGAFACENLGYIVQFIPSSRVNDGICDCCDGSDEYSGRITCPNTCDVLAAQKREEEEKLRKLKEEGFTKRKELIEEAAKLKKDLEDQAKELEAKKLELQNERTQLEERKNTLEVKAKEAKEKQDLIEQEKQKQLEIINLAKKVRELFDLLDVNKDLKINPEELVKYQELDIIFDNDGSFTIEESQKLLDEKTGVEYEEFETIYYPKISPHLKLEEAPKTDSQPTETTEQTGQAEVIGEETEHHHDHDHDHEHEHNHDHDHEHDHEHEHDHDHDHHHHDHSTPKPESKYDAETQALIDEADSARRLYEESDRKYRDVESELSDVQRKISTDTGLNGEFASMIGVCFEFEDREYIYKLCPFDRTVQKSKANNGETSIGNWKSWGDAEDKSKYNVMKFENGQGCWNGPQRSTKVLVTCGLENKVTSVSEPNRCEYEMKFETPAVCDEAAPASTGHVHDDL